MSAIVTKVNGKSPNEWTAIQTNKYVGRHLYLRSGKYADETWPNSGFGNPYRFEKQDSHSEKRSKLFAYCGWLKETLVRSRIIRDAFGELVELAKADTVVLGCWCVEWYGRGMTPLCHAAYLSAIINAINGPFSHGAVVQESGNVKVLISRNPEVNGCIVFKVEDF